VHRLPRRSVLPLVAAGVALVLLGATASLWPPSLIVFLEGKIYDSFLRSADKRPVTGNVTIVDLDEASLAGLGQWPWPRDRVALLLDRIRNGGATAVGLDMLFAEPDRTPSRRSPGATDTDGILAESLAGGPFVLGYQFDFTAVRGDFCILHPIPTAYRRRGVTEEGDDLFDAPGVVCNLPVLAKAAGHSGFFNVTPDPDGVLRRVPLVIRHRGRLYPSLALALRLRMQGGGTVVESGPEGVEAVLIDGRRIPLDRRGNLLVNYRGRQRAFPHLSAVSVLDGTADPALLKGKAVLVGTTAAGLKEIRTSPLDPSQPGVEIHATVLDNLLAGDPIAAPSWARGLQILLVLVPGLLLTGLLARARAAWGLAALVPSVAALVLGSYWLMTRNLLFVSPLMPSATLALVFTLLTSIRYMQTEREVRERTRKLALTQDAVIQSLAALTETRHHETGGHIQRTRLYIRALAERLRDHPRFRDYLDDAAVDLLFRLAPLHDIGKVGVRDRILLKPATLTPEEYEEMKLHTLYGSEAIRQAKGLLGVESFLKTADEIVLNHHERWDGSGYPHGLRGEEIPIPGRLMAVADAYDAIISERLYKPAYSHEDAVRSMSEKRGTYFDPDVLDAFLEVQEEFRRIASRFAGSGTEPETPEDVKG
jgi:adenylate cyclase